MDKQHFIQWLTQKRDNARKEWTRLGYGELLHLANNRTREQLEIELADIVEMDKASDNRRKPVSKFFREALNILKQEETAPNWSGVALWGMGGEINIPYSKVTYIDNQETFDMETSEEEAHERQYAMKDNLPFKIE